MRTKRAVLKELAPAFQRASKKRKGAMLDGFCGLTGYYRGYVSWLLRHCGQKVVWRGRWGSGVEKRYDEPKTPYQRVLESPYVAAEVKRQLRREYERLDIVEIKENID